ncbi:MAG: competence/damage-inducible protein A [Phycisphaerae bacterium]|nr:competence/damage-inducible protein A [Phycisphaerae bacterium]
MNKAAIISIGNELLNGFTTDTNTPFICDKLIRSGVEVVCSLKLPDDIEKICEGLEFVSRDAEAIIITGGLGPTDDDLTRQALAHFLKVELEFNERVFENMRQYFISRNYQMAEKNRVQAYFPKGSEPLPNPIGTAEGIAACADGKLYFALPGVPSEMEKMLQYSVLPKLSKTAKSKAIFIKKLKCFGAGESTIAQMLGDVMQRNRNPLVNCTVRQGVITLHIVAAAADEQKAKTMALAQAENSKDILGELVFGEDDQSLSQAVAEKLTKEGKTVAVAESCTGGLLAKMLTDIAGSSRYFTCGWVTYSNDAKIRELGVPVDLIEKYGAVSEQVAMAMATAARKKSGSDITVAITGIAGPGSTGQKPVGLVYIAIADKTGCRVEQRNFRADRESVRIRAAQTALNMLRITLKNR